MLNKKAKGLCFRCDDKFSPEHRCRDRTLQVLTVCDDEEDGDKEETEVETLEDEHLHLDTAEMSLNSVVGFTPNHTMKIKGKIGDREVIVLVDNGATHSFISNHVVQELGLPVSDTGSFGVVMGTGRIEKSRGVCRSILVTFLEVQVLKDFLPLDLGSTDVILGAQWLQTLGEMKVNWKLLKMEFDTNGH